MRGPCGVLVPSLPLCLCDSSGGGLSFHRALSPGLGDPASPHPAELLLLLGSWWPGLFSEASLSSSQRHQAIDCAQVCRRCERHCLSPSP